MIYIGLVLAAAAGAYLLIRGMCKVSGEADDDADEWLRRYGG